MATSQPPSYRTSLLTAQDCRGHIHLIVGATPLAATRSAQSLRAGAVPVLVAPVPSEPLHHALQERIDAGEVRWLQRPFAGADLFALGREEVGRVVDAVFVTLGASPAAGAAADPRAHISALCRRHRIPVNVVDAPALCSFSLLSTHTDGPLQLGVTTNGQGCHLAARIRREAVAGLPAGLGAACARLGEVRRRVREKDGGSKGGNRERVVKAGPQADEGVVADVEDQEPDHDEDDSLDQRADFNTLVLGVGSDADREDAKKRRMRWLAQVCEYWPLKRFAALTDEDVDAVLQSYPAHGAPQEERKTVGNGSGFDSSNSSKLGRLILAGSGPGHPDLLTQATLKAIHAADLVLADKLVPAGVLDLVPRRTAVEIARKFPGNADAAQDELLARAEAGVRAGQTVLRLKQGDPFLYGRGGEEVAHFRARGLGARVAVLPGVTSALAAPLLAGVPATMRDVADSVLVCTATGKKGKPPAPPEWVAGRTVVFLMALHRIGGLVGELTRHLEGEVGVGKEEEGARGAARDEAGPRRRRLWPVDTPCAVVERASCPDQRVIRTTLACVERAVEREGSRPPGLLVVGAACEALYTPEKGHEWTVEEGCVGLDLDDVLPSIAIPS